MFAHTSLTGLLSLVFVIPRDSLQTSRMSVTIIVFIIGLILLTADNIPYVEASVIRKCMLRLHNNNNQSYDIAFHILILAGDTIACVETSKVIKYLLRLHNKKLLSSMFLY